MVGSRLGRRRQLGFTLVEVAIVVGIIGILAAIAIPNYLRFQLHARAAEAPFVLGLIRTAQLQFFAAHDCYMDVAPNPAAIPPGGARFLFSTVPSGVAPCADAPAAFVDIGVDVGSSVHFQYQCTDMAVADAEGFTCDAEADLDNDGVRSAWALCSDHDKDGVCDGASAKGYTPPFPVVPVRVTSERH